MTREVMAEISEELHDDNARMEYGEELAKLDFALALVKARKAQGMTQDQLAARLGVSQAYIARLESGNANPTVGKAGKILASLWSRLSPHPHPLTEEPTEPASASSAARPKKSTVPS